MNHLVRITAFGFIFIFLSDSLCAQDSAIYKWNVSAKKKAERSYEITLTTGGVKGWQLYAPGQSFDEFKTAEIILPDSSIGQTCDRRYRFSQKLLKARFLTMLMLGSMKVQRFGNRQFISTVLFRPNYRVS